MPILLSEFAAQLWAGDPNFALPGSNTSAPPGLEALLEYNGIILHDRYVVDKYRVLGIDGLHGVEIRVNREINPSSHGSTPLNNLLGVRSILITGRVEAHNIGKLRDMMQALRTAFYSMTEKPLIFRVGDIARDVYINCRMIDKLGAVEEQSRQDTFRDFQITMEATDPRYRSIMDHNHSISLGVEDNNSSGLISQWDLELGSGDLVNDGSWLTPPGVGVYLFTRLGLSYNPINLTQTIKIRTSTNTGSSQIENILKYSNSGNYISGIITSGGLTVRLGVVRVDNSVRTTVIEGSDIVLSSNTEYWFQSQWNNGVVTVKLFDNDPLTTGRQVGSTVTSARQTFPNDTTTGVRLNTIGGTIRGIGHFRLEPNNLDHILFRPVNKGNFLATPRFRIYGPMSDVTISNEAFMPDENYIRSVIINGRIPGGGDYYEYNAEKGILVDQDGVNKNSQLDVSSDQIQIGPHTGPNSNIISIAATSLSTIYPRLSLIFQDTWI